MGSILIDVPNFSDGQLAFDATETRQILRFFWRHQTGLEDIEITDHVRRLAQTALFSAIEGSYAMGFLAETLKSVQGSYKLAQWGRKLARALIGHVWRHATQQDLQDVRIYEAIRKDVSLALRRDIDMVTQGLVLRRGHFHFYAHCAQTSSLA